MSFFRFDHPELLWLLLLMVPIVWLGRRSLATLDPVRRWTAIVGRCAVLAVIVLMLSGLQTVRRHSDLTVIAVVDQSQSVRRFAHPPPPDVSPGQGGGQGGSAGGAAGADAREGIERWVDQYLRASGDDKRPDDKFGLITFDARPTVRALPRNSIDMDPGTVDQPKDGTDTAAALRMAMAQFPPDSGARLVLASDGNDTPASASGDSQNAPAAADQAGETSGGGGGLLTAAREAAAAGVPIDVLPLHYRVKHEVMVQGVYAPTRAREGQTLAVRVVLRATEPTAGMLQVVQDGQVVDFNGEAPGTGVPITKSQWSSPGSSPDQAGGTAGGGDDQAGGPSGGGDAAYVLAKQVELPAGGAGPTRFEAVFEPDQPATASLTGQPAAATDEMAANNKAQGFTLVSGKGKVLFIDNLGGDSGAILPNALAREGVQVQVVGPGGLPTTLGSMQKYDAVVFQNVPAELVTGPQQRMLTRYVHDLGGGFVMVGGPKSFGAGGWTNTPIDKYVLPVTCQIPSQTVLPSGALALVLDRSGSMGSTVGGTNKSQQEVADEAAVLAHATLYPQDVISVIAFDSSATSIVDPQLNTDPSAVVNKIRSIQPGGGTNIYSGLEMAYQKFANLSTQDAAIKHVILLTDGSSTAPPGSGGYIKIIGQMRRAGITVSTVGVGDGHNAALLTQLAQMGGGHYYPIKNPNNLPQVFIKEARTIRKNLIKEKTFEPKLVNTGSPIMTAVHGVPELKGLVLTGERQDPRVFTPMLGPDGEPLFAHWQVGLGRAAAFTSDATNKWASPWLGWGGYGDFWSRTLREVARPSATREADLITTVRGNTLHLRLDASAGLGEASDNAWSSSQSFGNFLKVRGAVVAPDGSTHDVTLHQTGPGIYQASLPAEDPGNYIASLIVRDTTTGHRYTAFGGASEPPGRELRTLRSHDALLRQVARMTGGRVLDPANPQAAGLFARDRDFTSRSVRPVWRRLLVLLLVLFFLDVANRRVAWDIAASWAWIKVRVASASGSLSSRPAQGEGTLSAWKKVRAGARTKPAEPVPDPPTATPPSRQRKFEADHATVVRDDFAQAVGGASRDAAGSSTATAARRRAGEDATGGEADADGPTTSRLLGAKRRAREQYHDDDNPKPQT